MKSKHQLTNGIGKRLNELFISNNMFSILYTIMSNPNCNVKFILKNTNIPNTSTHRYLEKLENAGIITKYREGENFNYKPGFRYTSNIKKLQITLSKNKFTITT